MADKIMSSKSATSHYVEAALWLIFAAFLFIQTFSFNQEIEIYKYGAASWPRVIIVLMAVAAIGQLIFNRTRASQYEAGKMSQAMDDSTADQGSEGGNTGLVWYLHTAFLVALPFVYINLPKLLAGTTDVGSPELNRYKLICAALVSVLFIVGAWRNHIGAVLALPVLFAAMLQDLGFYALAPLFILGIMFLMGERRAGWMASVMLMVYAVLMLMFVVILYVGLPTGYVRPFYDFGTWMVTLLQ